MRVRPALFSLLLALGTPLQSAALLQSPPPEASKDSTPCCRHPWGLLPLMIGLGALAAVAPAAIQLLPLPKDTMPSPYGKALGIWDHHVSAYVTGGFTEQFTGDNDHGWAHSASVEVLQRHFYGEFRIENYYFPGYFRARTLRTGYLFRPKANLAWGVTLGYRETHGDRVHDAVEVGLPVILSQTRPDRKAEIAFRLEPIYRFSSEGPSWNYRLQSEFYLPSVPLVPGFCFDVTRVRRGSPYFGTLTLLLGVRG